MGRKFDMDAVCDILEEANWNRADSKGRRSLRLTEEAGDVFGFMGGGNQKKRYVHPKNEYSHAIVSRGGIRFFIQKGGIILEDEFVPIDDIDQIKERADKGR